jgi:ClpP class serine protease
MPTWGEILKELQQVQQGLSQKGVTPATGNPFDLVRRKYLSALAKHTGRNVILYATKWTQGGVEPDAISITIEDVQGFMEVVHGLSGEKLDLILHLPGGSPEATEALVTYLRSKFSDIRVLIPHAAMSAACMLACAADRIVMGKHSFIGPIDPQFIMATEMGRASVPAYAILEQFKQAQGECSDPKLLPSWLPMLRQYGPALIVQCRLAIELSESLVSDWLARYMFAKDPDPKAKAEKVGARLTDHPSLKSHGRFISREQARTYGLVVEDLEADQALQDALLSVFHATTHTLAATPAVKIIENHQGKAFVKSQQMMMLQQPRAGNPVRPTIPAGMLPPGVLPPA